MPSCRYCLTTSKSTFSSFSDRTSNSKTSSQVFETILPVQPLQQQLLQPNPFPFRHPHPPLLTQSREQIQRNSVVIVVTLCVTLHQNSDPHFPLTQVCSKTITASFYPQTLILFSELHMPNPARPSPFHAHSWLP